MAGRRVCVCVCVCVCVRERERVCAKCARLLLYAISIPINAQFIFLCAHTHK